MSKTAYQGRKLGEALEGWEAMIKEKDKGVPGREGFMRKSVKEYYYPLHNGAGYPAAP